MYIMYIVLMILSVAGISEPPIYKKKCMCNTAPHLQERGIRLLNAAMQSMTLTDEKFKYTELPGDVKVGLLEDKTVCLS